MTLLERFALLAFVASAGCVHHKTAVVDDTVPHDPIQLRGDAKLVDLLVEPTSPLIFASAQDELGIHVRISAKALPDARRPPLDVALVLDTSGSMDGAAIDGLRASAHAFVDKLHDGDRAALVTFDSRTAILLASTEIGTVVRAAAHKAIDGIAAHGTTDLASGLASAMQQLGSHARAPSSITRIVLLSDGVPNTADTLPGLLAQIKASGYSVTTLGLGLDYDTTLMTRIAADTGGSFHYIEKADQIAAVFDDELGKMSTVVGRNLQLQLAPGPGVTFEPLAGYSLQGNRLYANIGDLPAGGVRDLVFPIHVTARGEGSTAELVDATLTFEDVIGQSGAQQRLAYASAKVTKDQAAITAAMKIDLEVARVRASAASAILEAMNLARSGQLDPARKRMAQAIAAVRTAQTRLKTSTGLDATIAELASVTKELAQMVVPTPAISMGSGPRPTSEMDAPAMAPPRSEAVLRKSQASAAATMRGDQ